MENRAICEDNKSFDIYLVKVNDQTVYGCEKKERAKEIVDRLNKIFLDPHRDLDFITPSYINNKYVVCCPKVRKNVGEVTYLFDTSNGARGFRSYPAKLYESSNWSDSVYPEEQTAILEISHSATAPWHEALTIANSIRSAVKLNFPDALGNENITQLKKPDNYSGEIANIISQSAKCEYYGVPCQGTQPGRTSPCPEIGFNAQNILNTNTYNEEVFHPQDLTAAITPTSNWFDNYLNKYIRVTNLADEKKSIVVRVTDMAPRGKGIELSYRAWVEIGRPSGPDTVKLELMK